MSNEREEFTELRRDTREYLAYLDEMGVAFLEPGEVKSQRSKGKGQGDSPSFDHEATLSTPYSPLRSPEPATLFSDLAPDNSLKPSDETLEDIRRDIGADCKRCPLCAQGRRQVVNSEGHPRARLMFVGEAPGADEDAQGRPFVGRAGQLLDRIIASIGLKREEVFIGNINRCRPPANRTPLPDEAAVCKPFLMREIAVVRPDIIVVLGNTAMKHLLDTKEGITKMRGIFRAYQGVTVMPTFHPAYLLRDPTKKRETWEDMKKVRDYLAQNQSG